MTSHQTHLSEEEELCLAPCIPVVCPDCPFGEVGDDPTEDNNGWVLSNERNLTENS